MGSRQLVTTQAQHFWDLDIGTYERRPVPHSPFGPMPYDSERHRITRVDWSPVVGHQSLLYYDDPSKPWEREQFRRSSVITRIEHLPTQMMPILSPQPVNCKAWSARDIASITRITNDRRLCHPHDQRLAEYEQAREIGLVSRSGRSAYPRQSQLAADADSASTDRHCRSAGLDSPQEQNQSMSFDDLLRLDVGPRIARIDDAPALRPIDPRKRRRLWSGLGLVPTIERLTRVLAELDLATIGNGTADPSVPVVEQFLAGIGERPREQARQQLERGNEVPHPIPLVVAIKEVLEFADPDSKNEASDETLFAALLTISAEVREAATPPRGTRPDEALEILPVQQAPQSGPNLPAPAPPEDTRLTALAVARYVCGDADTGGCMHANNDGLSHVRAVEHTQQAPNADGSSGGSFSEYPEGGAPLGPGSLIWKYFCDRRATLLLPAIGTLQNMHPTVSAGVADHSTIFRTPFDRARRTMPPLIDVVFTPPSTGAGPTLRDFHTDIKGVRPDGERYHALTPDVYWFTHVTFIEFVLLNARYFYGHEFTGEEKEQLIRESVTWWSRYGMSMRPVIYTWAEYQEYLDRACNETLEYTPLVKWSLEDSATNPWEAQLGLPRWLFRLATRIGHTVGGRTAVLSPLPLRYRDAIGVRTTRLDDVQFRILLRIVNIAWRAVPARWRYFPAAYEAMQRAGRPEPV